MKFPLHAFRVGFYNGFFAPWIFLGLMEKRELDYGLLKCPSCGGYADNGFDRGYPPAPYFCTKCEGEKK